MKDCAISAFTTPWWPGNSIRDAGGPSVGAGAHPGDQAHRHQVGVRPLSIGTDVIRHQRAKARGLIGVGGGRRD